MCFDDEHPIGQAGEIVVVGLMRQPETDRGLLLHRSREPHDRRHREDEAEHRRHRPGGRHVVEGDDDDGGEQGRGDREQTTATHRVDRAPSRPGEDPDRRVQDGRSDRRRHEQVWHLEQTLVDDDAPGVAEREHDVADEQTCRAAEQQREGRRTLPRRERQPCRQHEEAHRDRGVDGDRDPGHHPRVLETERGQDQHLVDEQQRAGAEHDAVEQCPGLVGAPAAPATGRRARRRTARSRGGRTDPGATIGSTVRSPVASVASRATPATVHNTPAGDHRPPRPTHVRPMASEADAGADDATDDHQRIRDDPQDARGRGRR